MFTLKNNDEVTFASADEFRSFCSAVLTGVVSDFFDNAPALLQKAQVFVAMMKSIADANRKAADAAAERRFQERQAELENLVKERTAELEKTIENLRKEIESKNSEEKGETL